MKNKLHTMLRQAQQPQAQQPQAQQPQAQQPNQQLTVTEPSRSAASHPVCHSVGVTKLWSLSLRLLSPVEVSKCQILLSSILLILCSIPTTAQPYQWQWAINGGGSGSGVSSGGWHIYAEQIYDIAIDKNNNYYFLANITGSSPQLNGQPVTEYGNNSNGNDIFLFSTTCNGTVRWSQAIGGGGAFDRAFKIALDSNNNVYVGVYVQPSNGNKPVHFSPTEVLPVTSGTPNIVSDHYKTTFLVKYDTNGQFVWKRALQGDVADGNSDSSLNDILIDSNDNIHFIVGLLYGTHLNNTVTVPSQYNASDKLKHYLVQFSSNGQLLSSMALPFDYGSRLVELNISFKFNEANNRYYIAGFRLDANSSSHFPLSYQGTVFTKNAFILAIDATNGNELWRREMAADTDDCRIYDLVLDNANGDIYIGGKINRKSGTDIKIINSKNPTLNPYAFSLSVNGNMPFIAKLNSSGTVQWARTPSGYNLPTADTRQYYGYGLALRNNANEVAFATMGSNTIWDGFSISRPQGHESDPLLMRFNKQTGAVIGMHDIQGSAGKNHMLTAVAVDNDGNYVVGGGYQGSLFTSGGTVSTLGSIGYYDFFVAKLGASTCGTAVSTDKFNNIKVKVYPNPTNDIVNIETQETLQNYEVYNVLGQQIQQGNFNGNNQINLHGATAGTYFIKVTTTQGSTATVKVLKK